MPTYEYKCKTCGLRFERVQMMSDAPLRECPECRGEVSRLVSGGVGFTFKGSGVGRINTDNKSCALEQTGKTCCGRGERCDKPGCDY